MVAADDWFDDKKKMLLWSLLLLFGPVNVQARGRWRGSCSEKSLSKKKKRAMNKKYHRGVNCFDGFVYEHGLFNFEAGKIRSALPKLYLNPYSWSKETYKQSLPLMLSY